MLYIVSTPIGNLKDITLRALEVLKSVDLIACEDTRHTGMLLKAYAIEKPLTSYFEHNQRLKTDYLIGLLKEGKNIALVSDAGTPGISDPGYPLIEATQRLNIPMTVIPGPVAFVAGLTLSGFPANEFVFVGFLPVKSGQRKNKLTALLKEQRTIIAYESTHRIIKTLQDLQEVMPEARIVVAREITKMFEQVHRGTAGELVKYFEAHPPKGEFVLLISAA